jgi:hypothetical protein
MGVTSQKTGGDIYMTPAEVFQGGKKIEEILNSARIRRHVGFLNGEPVSIRNKIT